MLLAFNVKREICRKCKTIINRIIYYRRNYSPQHELCSPGRILLSTDTALLFIDKGVACSGDPHARLTFCRNVGDEWYHDNWSIGFWKQTNRHTFIYHADTSGVDATFHIKGNVQICTFFELAAILPVRSFFSEHPVWIQI